MGWGWGDTVGLSGSVMYKQRGVSIGRVGCHAVNQFSVRSSGVSGWGGAVVNKGGYSEV